MSRLNAQLEERLIQFTQRLVDQRRARIIVPPQHPAPGFWFGGGNLTAGPDGSLYLVGRYRNAGDSRLGVTAGERGAELAIFRSEDRGQTFQKLLHWEKQDLDLPGRKVLSIEGSALHWTSEGVELFISSEKEGIGYPIGFDEFLKPGAGVWTIDCLTAKSLDRLKNAEIEPLLESSNPEFLHIKDPFVYESDRDGTLLFFCSHPYCWSSSNTGYAVRRPGEARFGPMICDFFPRGFTWDVAMTRGTCLLDVPQVGAFRDVDARVFFYDGGEALRNLDEHAQAVKRPRGYSCEELGGAAYVLDGDLDHIHRLSRFRPLFVSPFGTGCCRYVKVLPTPEGLFVTWQQSQQDGSQPLVMNFVSQAQVAEVLA